MDQITYITDKSLLDIPIIYSTGEQIISGYKDFTERPTFSGEMLLTTGDPIRQLSYHNDVFIIHNNDIEGYFVAKTNNYSDGHIGIEFYHPDGTRLGYSILGNRYGDGFVQSLSNTFRIEKIFGDLAYLQSAGLKDDFGRIFSLPSQEGTLALLADINNLSGQISNIVYTTGNQTINGIKTFLTRPIVNGTGVLLSGEIPSLPSTLVYTTGNQTISGNKNFVNDVYIKNLFVTGTETIVSTTNFNVQSPYLILNLTGGANDGGIFFVTGSGLTGINDYGPIIGFDHSKNFKFGVARRSDDLAILNDIASVQDITNYSGYVDNKYATILNLASTGSNLQQQINNINSSGFITGVDLSNLYPRNNPSGYITGVDLSSYITHAQTGNFVTTSQTGAFYAASNPNGYITGVDLSNYYTNNNPSGYVRGIVNTTYSALTGLKAANRLVSGQHYRISDFHLTWWNQSINDTTVKSGLAGEPLIVQALSQNKISHEAKSELYPQDTIYYDIDASGSYSWGTINNNTAIPNFKGWIYRRIDHKLNIDIAWDWRHITVNCCRPNMTSIGLYNSATTYSFYSVVKNASNKLYYSIQNNNTNNTLTNINFWLPVSAFTEGDTYFVTDESYGFRAFNEAGAFVNLPANTGTRIQQPTFSSSLVSQGAFALTSCNNIKIEGGHSNVFLGTYINDITIGNDFYYNTIGMSFSDNIIGNRFNFNTIGGLFLRNIIANSFNHNTIQTNFYENTLGNNSHSNTIGTDFYSNTIGNSFYSNTIGNLFVSNTIGDNFNSNAIGDNFYSNTIENTSYSNTIGNTFNSNTIGDSFFSNTIGNFFISNTIGDSFFSNTIGNFFVSNTIGDNFYSNAIGNLFNSNAIGNLFISNAIGDNFYSNAIGNTSYSNTIGNTFNSNTIRNNFFSNTIGNSFNSNAIGDSFFSNTIGNDFRRNTVETATSINITGATHVYNNYNTTIFRNSNNTVRLSYFNSDDQLVVTDPTA